jgi:hypothetical protein
MAIGHVDTLSFLDVHFHVVLGVSPGSYPSTISGLGAPYDITLLARFLAPQ